MTYNKPCANVGYGKIVFSASTYELLDNKESYKNIEIKKIIVDGKECIEIDFLLKSKIDSLEGRFDSNFWGDSYRITINAKKKLEEFFGEVSSQNAQTKYPVFKNPYKENSIIIYDLDKIEPSIPYRDIKLETKVLVEGLKSISEQMQDLYKQ